MTVLDECYYRTVSCASKYISTFVLALNRMVLLLRVSVWAMLLNATSNNISAVSCQSALLVEECKIIYFSRGVYSCPYCASHHFLKYFSYIAVVSFNGGENHKTVALLSTIVSIALTLTYIGRTPIQRWTTLNSYMQNWS
jgi:hypothetical protein